VTVSLPADGIVICATDTHGSRAVLNDLAAAYLLPVIAVGVQAGARKNADLAALVAEIAVLTPLTPCLWCRGRISADVIRAENLPADQRERHIRGVQIPWRDVETACLSGFRGVCGV